MTETLIGGFAHGDGDLTYQGQAHPFRRYDVKVARPHDTVWFGSSVQLRSDVG
jgi:hypothetical protein